MIRKSWAGLSRQRVQDGAAGKVSNGRGWGSLLFPLLLEDPRRAPGGGGDSKQERTWSSSVCVGILVSGLGFFGRKSGLLSLLLPQELGTWIPTGAVLSGRWERVRGHGSDDPSLPHLLPSALLYLWLVLTELGGGPRLLARGGRRSCWPWEADVSVRVLPRRGWRVQGSNLPLAHSPSGEPGLASVWPTPKPRPPFCSLEGRGLRAERCLPHRGEALLFL